jgi:hypothetical protein
MERSAHIYRERERERGEEEVLLSWILKGYFVKYREKTRRNEKKTPKILFVRFLCLAF